MEPEPRRDLTRTVLAVLVIGALIAASVWIVRPFLAASIWATMIVVTTWPVLAIVQRRLWNKRWLATSILTAALLLVFVAPLTAAVGTIVAYSDDIVDWTDRLSSIKVPPPPDFVGNLPIVGAKAAAAWQGYAELTPEKLADVVGPYVSGVARWFVAEAGSVGLVALQLILTVVLSAILYMSGDDLARGVRRFARRLAGVRGDDVVLLAGQAIRGVALGVVVTALVQSVLAGAGLALAGVPFAGLLTAVMFMLALAQVGVVPVMLGAIAWLWWSDSTGWVIAMVVWTIVVSALDNVLRPMLIRRGADLPLLLIFAGVIGGLFAFGLIGLFVGPVLLAVAYTLLDAWVSEAPELEPGASGSAAHDLPVAPAAEHMRSAATMAKRGPRAPS